MPVFPVGHSGGMAHVGPQDQVSVAQPAVRGREYSRALIDDPQVVMSMMAHHSASQ